MRPANPIRWALGEWIAATPLWRLVLRYDGPAPVGARYINRLNGHVVVLRDGSPS